MDHDLSKFAFTPQEKYSDGKYSFYEISDGSNAHRRINCETEGVCLLPFDLNDHGQIHHVYLQKYLDYFNGAQEYCCVHQDIDPEQDHSHYDALLRACEKEFAMNDIEVDNIFYLGKVSHTVPFSKTYRKSYLEKNRKKYNLRFLTFRHPSEHLLDSKNHSLEMQIYHKSEDEQWLVVSYFLEIADDLMKNNVKFDSLIDFIISKKNEDIFNLAEIIDPQGLVFFYDGSFTTPPCYEGVKWYVFQKPIIISKEQMLTLIKKTIFVKSNVRQVQKFNPEKF